MHLHRLIGGEGPDSCFFFFLLQIFWLKIHKVLLQLCSCKSVTRLLNFEPQGLLADQELNEAFWLDPRISPWRSSLEEVLSRLHEDIPAEDPHNQLSKALGEVSGRS